MDIGKTYLGSPGRVEVPTAYASALLSLLATGVVFLTLTLAAYAQDYPIRSIKVIVPYPPGAGTDTLARMTAEKLQSKWGQPVLVENRGGANGNIGAEAVFKAAPDGYTVLFSAPGPLVTSKSLYAKLAFDPDAFVPVSVVAMGPSLLAVHPKARLDSVQQLIAFAKANPDQLSYASGGSGSTPHLAAELFKIMAGVKILHVPYNASARALAGLLGGEVHISFLDLGTVLPQVRAGRVHALAVGSEKRVSSLPDVPTVSEVLPGYLSIAWFGMVAPPKTPPAIVDKISTAIAEGIKESDFANRVLGMNMQAVGNTPAEMALLIRQDRERWGNVIRITGAKLE